jgi:acyl carrier protein
MTEADIYAGLTAIFRDIFDDETITLTPETTADDVEGWDSFNHINLIVSAEAKFGVKFKSAEVEELKNVDEFVQLIKRQVG